MTADEGATPVGRAVLTAPSDDVTTFAALIAALGFVAPDPTQAAHDMDRLASLIANDAVQLKRSRWLGRQVGKSGYPVQPATRSISPATAAPGTRYAA